MVAPAAGEVAPTKQRLSSKKSTGNAYFRVEIALKSRRKGIKNRLGVEYCDPSVAEYFPNVRERDICA